MSIVIEKGTARMDVLRILNRQASRLYRSIEADCLADRVEESRVESAKDSFTSALCVQHKEISE